MGGGSLCPPVTDKNAAIQFSFSTFLPADVSGPCGAGDLLTAQTLWWYLSSHQFSYDESLEMTTRFFSKVADRLGLSSSGPDGRGVPDYPPPATVYPPDVFRDNASLGQYNAWAAALAPVHALASYDPQKHARGRRTPHSGLQKVMARYHSVGIIMAEQEPRRMHWCYRAPRRALGPSASGSRHASHSRHFVPGGRMNSQERCHLCRPGHMQQVVAAAEGKVPSLR